MDAPIGDLIRSAETGDAGAARVLFDALYRELHGIAERELRRGGPELTLGATTLLHEAYLNVAHREGLQFASRNAFLAYAARAMRGLMIDYVRRRRATKRGGEFHITAADSKVPAHDGAESAGEIEQVGAALEVLGDVNPELAQLVDLHFYCGYSFSEIAALRGSSERTVYRDWRRARLLLHRALQEP